MPGARGIDFRPLGRNDFPQLARWFSEPHVERWWNQDSSLDGIETKYGPRVDGLEPTSMWVIEVGGRPAGLAQHYLHVDYPEHDAAVGISHAVGIDYLLGADFAGQGLGPAVLGELASFVLAHSPNARCCVATPAQANRPSCVALERAGFRRHGPSQPPEEPLAWTYVWNRSASPATLTTDQPPSNPLHGRALR